MLIQAQEKVNVDSEFLIEEDINMKASKKKRRN